MCKALHGILFRHPAFMMHNKPQLCVLHRSLRAAFYPPAKASAGAVKGGGTLSIRPPERDKCSMKPLKPFRTEKSDLFPNNHCQRWQPCLRLHLRQMN